MSEILLLSIYLITTVFVFVLNIAFGEDKILAIILSTLFWPVMILFILLAWLKDFTELFIVRWWFK